MGCGSATFSKSRYDPIFGSSVCAGSRLYLILCVPVAMVLVGEYPIRPLEPFSGGLEERGGAGAGAAVAKGINVGRTDRNGERT